MKLFGKEIKLFEKKNNGRNGVNGGGGEVLPLARPVDSVPWVSADVAKLPMLPVSLRFAYDLFYWSDVLRLIIKALVYECFRNGLYVERKFAVKCNVCGTEYDQVVVSCEVCGSKNFRYPDPKQKIMLEKFLKDVNLNDEDLIDVLMACDFDLNIADNAFLVVRKRYGFDEYGEVAVAEPIEILRGSPLVLRLVMNRDGRPGMTDDGKVVAICLEHRDEYVLASQEEMKEGVRCKKCGKKMYPAYYEMVKGGRRIFFTNGEVLHFKKFTAGVGYGFPMPFTLMIKLIVLMKQDYFVLMAYHLQRPPKGLLILRGNRASVAKSWEYLMERMRQNPWSIYPLVIEDGDARRVAEWLDLSFSSSEISFVSYREELRRIIGMAYGVSPIFQGDLSTASGIANQGLQITVTNRAVEMEQRIFNEKVLPWLCTQLGVSDWVIRLRPHEEKDVASQLQRIMMRIEIAQQMKALGYNVILVEGVDGIEFRFEEKDAVERLKDLVGEIAKKLGADVDVDNVVKKLLLEIGGGGKEESEDKGGDRSEEGESEEGESEEEGEVTEADVEAIEEKITEAEVPEKPKKIRIEEQQWEGEPMWGRVRRREQRFSGEPHMPRRWSA